MQWRSRYIQGDYFSYRINQCLLMQPSALPKSDLDFNGWYLQGSWILTGETRVYKTDSAAFGAPKPDSIWGAWELGARYSVLDLNDNCGNAGLATPYGGVRGGEQKIWSAGINWYPNAALRFSADYENIDISRLGSTGLNVGQKLDAVSLRAQISL